MIKTRKLNTELLIADQSDVYLKDFWERVYPSWEAQTFRDIMPKLSKDKTFVDIGSWQGPISLIAQKYSDRCICFEPDPISYKNLKSNIEINGFDNIYAENKAVSNEKELSIGGNSDHPLGRGISSFLNESDNNVMCDTISITNILKKYNLNSNNISVLKIDVEGYEIELLNDPILKELNVDMHVSFHPHLFKDTNDFLYRVSDFLPAGFKYNIQGGFDLFIPKK